MLHFSFELPALVLGGLSPLIGKDALGRRGTEEGTGHTARLRGGVVGFLLFFFRLTRGWRKGMGVEPIVPAPARQDHRL